MRGPHDGLMPLHGIVPPHARRSRTQAMGHAMRSHRILLLVEISLTVALSAALNLLALRLPINFAGGSISLSMVPIFVLALRRGVVAGLIAGFAFGCVDLVIEPYFLAPIQVLLDYGVAYAAVGLAGLGSGAFQRASSRSLLRGAAVAVPFMLLGCTGRFAAAWTSGVVFFASNAPAGQPVWLYSIIYNASYILPSLLISITAAVLILPVLQRAVPVLSANSKVVSA